MTNELSIKLQKARGTYGRNQEIIAKNEDGMGIRALAREYSLSPATILRIVSRPQKRKNIFRRLFGR